MLCNWSQHDLRLYTRPPSPLMGWGRPAPLRCELNLPGRPCGAGWLNKDYIYRGLLFGKQWDL